MPKILIADDSIAVRKVAERLLTEAGMAVSLAANGTEALTFLGKECPDLVVSDVIMPDKSGYEVCSFVRNQPSLINVPVLLISGIVNDEVTRQAEMCRADGVLKKPFQGTSLKDRVHDLLSKRQSKPAATAVNGNHAAAAMERPVAPPPKPAGPEDRSPSVSGADVAAKDNMGRTPLHWAALEGKHEQVAELLRVGSSVFVADAKGRTPLHLAAMGRSETVIDALLAAGAPRAVRDNDNLTPRELALETRRSRNDRYRDVSERL